MDKKDKTLTSKCFGYLNFYTDDEANRCLNKLNNALLDGHQIVLVRKTTHFNHGCKTKVMVKNLPKEVDQNQFESLFSEYGIIEAHRHELFTKPGAIGYVKFEKREIALSAVNALNGTKLYGKTIRVYI